MKDESTKNQCRKHRDNYLDNMELSLETRNRYRTLKALQKAVAIYRDRITNKCKKRRTYMKVNKNLMGCK